MKIQGFGLTDVGVVRSHNEDSFLVDNDLRLYIVSDGVGGRNAGEVASQMGVDVIKDHMRNAEDVSAPFIGTKNKDLSETTNRLGSAIRLANQIVHESAKSKPNLQGMGATVVAVTFKENTMSLAHAGDSRAYLIRNGEISQLTSDHSLVNEQLQKGLINEEEARLSTIKNVITRALGPEADIKVELAEHEFKGGDAILLCSDGLSNLVPDELLLSTMEDADRIERACVKLIQHAKDNGGDDNITAVIVHTEKSGIFSFFKKLSV
jgi:protein phosphatase